MVGIAVAAALVWVVFMTTWLWINQERVVFQPPGPDVQTPGGATRIEFLSADRAAVYGYLVVPHRGAPGPIVLAFHGNADLAAWYVPWARELADRTGATVLVPEYRGYGGLPGKPTYATAAADAVGAWRYAHESFGDRAVVLFGHSLGTAVATELASTMTDSGARPAALVLQSPFTSARDMAARMLVPPVPWLWNRIARVRYTTSDVVARLDVPVSVAHGTRDVVIPVRMGRQVYAAARKQGELLIVEGAGHNDVPDAGGERYWRWLSAAVTATVPLRDVSAGR